MDFAGKRVLITGGAVRVGAALAEGFARSGAKITIHYRRSAEEAERLLCALPGEGHDCIYADLADPASAQELICRTGHRVDILVNNASYYVRDAADAAVVERIAAVEANYLSLAVLGLVLPVISQIGDLFASLIKREAGIKDYSRLFPGHGGIMDRFDSTIPVAILLQLLLVFPYFENLI